MTNEFLSILETIETLPREYVTVANGLGRVIAEPIKARTSMPLLDVATTDGYAVRYNDIMSVPATLTVQGESSSARHYTMSLHPGCAIKTSAGGNITNGADTLVMHSDAIDNGDGTVTITAQAVTGENICPKGMDFSTDTVSFKSGTIMNSRLVGLASTMHLLWLPVVRKPRVAILAVGSELSLPGISTDKNPITASSLYTIPANVAASGGEPIILGVSGDTIEEVQARIREAAGCDLLITTGATSAGANYLMQKALEGMVDELKTLRIELNRNDMMYFGRYLNMPICALPGNPTSSSIYFSIYVQKIINRMVGVAEPQKQFAILGRSVDEHDTSVAYLHASLSIDRHGTYQAIPVSAQDGFMLTELAKADCLVKIDKNPDLKKGDFVEVIPFSHAMVST